MNFVFVSFGFWLLSSSFYFFFFHLLFTILCYALNAFALSFAYLVVFVVKFYYLYNVIISFASLRFCFRFHFVFNFVYLIAIVSCCHRCLRPLPCQVLHGTVARYLKRVLYQLGRDELWVKGLTCELSLSTCSE